MRSILILLLVLTFPSAQLQAQVYKVTTGQQDPFSLAFVKLLNCAAGRFKDCTGDSIRSTSLMGDDHKLSFSFPGSAMAIVRSRDGDRNAYIEFRGFTGKEGREQAIRELVVKIKKALGPQLYDENKNDKEIYFYGLSIKDTNGYFSMNIELFWGRSSAPIYLLGPEWEDESQPKKDFVLLKIYGGIPTYQYDIHTVPPPDALLDITLQKLLVDATTDFDKIKLKEKDSLLKKTKRKRDTVQLNGFNVLLNYRGGNYSANMQFDAAPDTAAFNLQWLHYQKAVQAAVGSGYVYYLYNNGYPHNYRDQGVLYYSRDQSNKPRIYLSLEKGADNRRFIQIKIQSTITHATKRSLDPDDL